MPRLLLVRHGETEGNSAERYWGHTDVKLSASGLWQAEQLHHRLANEQIDAIYSSDLSRAIITARAIAADHNLEVIICPELREVNFGKLEGLNYAEIVNLYPDVARLWSERSPALRYPGGESRKGFHRRVLRFLTRLEKHTEEETVLVVAHSGSLRVLMCRLLGFGLRHWWQFRLELGSLSIMETYPQGAILNLLNDTGHLKKDER